jgi:hypothetical protein
MALGDSTHEIPGRRRHPQDDRQQRLNAVARLL